MARTVSLHRAELIARQHATTLSRLAVDYPPLGSALAAAREGDAFGGPLAEDFRIPLHDVVTAIGY